MGIKYFCDICDDVISIDKYNFLTGIKIELNGKRNEAEKILFKLDVCRKCLGNFEDDFKVFVNTRAASVRYR